MTIVFGQREDILRCRIDVRKGIAVVEVDVTNRRDNHTARLCTLDGLRAIVCQAVRSIKRIKDTILFTSSNADGDSQQHSQQQYFHVFYHTTNGLFSKKIFEYPLQI